MALTIGVDVGGTKIAAGLVDDDGRIVTRLRKESPATDSHAIEDTIAGLVRELCSSDEATREGIAGMGVAAAGFISADRSTAIFAPNLAWRDEPLRSELEARTGLPVVVENDANAAAWGEFKFGAATAVNDMLMVTVGTGVGGGIVLDGQLYRGGAGIAAEVGHLCVMPEGRPCHCGSVGCWEQYASGSALVRMAREGAAREPQAAAALIEATGGVESIDGPSITEAAMAGDGFARRQLEELGYWLGTGLASLAAVLDPSIIVIGGGVAHAETLLIAPTQERFLRQLTGRGHRAEPVIVQAVLGNDAGMVGAANQAKLAFA